MEMAVRLRNRTDSTENCSAVMNLRRGKSRFIQIIKVTRFYYRSALIAKPLQANGQNSCFVGQMALVGRANGLENQGAATAFLQLYAGVQV